MINIVNHYRLCIILTIFLLSMPKLICYGSLNGKYTKYIENYRLAVPHKLNLKGEHVTFDLTQHFLPKSRGKLKRSNSDEEAVHYGVNINGEDYHLELTPNHELLSPNLIFENRNPKQEIKQRELRTLTDKHVCYYTGYVRGKRNSRVALSTCNGLAGYITLDNVRYFIEPVENHQANEEGHHLHIIHPEKENDKRFKCGTKGNWEEAWKDRFRKQFLQNKNLFLQKRGATSEHRYLETLVVADKKFVEYHKNRDMENYILTIMNMVSDLYHDASSGNQMDVVVVRIIYLEKEEEEIDLVINTDADKTLASFCKWQQHVNPKDVENPNHHDIAVLLTRYDICSSDADGCGLMGLAYVAAACTPNENCAINEDGGLVLGTVVAHEMGHVMGCSHDKEGESSCPAQDKDLSFFVMAPFVHIHTTKWSSCSKGFMTALFENNLGECLNDEAPISIYHYKNALPGTIYDANMQCDLLFPGSTLCEMAQQQFCEILLCKTSPTQCLGNDEPPVDGTKCGENKWCFHKKCVEIGQRPEAINGGWGSWNSWSHCSRTCGGGVAISERECNNPVPQYNGKYCLGDRKKVKICNNDPCPVGAPSFRTIQCEEFNKKPFNGLLRTWKPFPKEDEPCVLYCLNEVFEFAKLAPRVKDGTPCKAGTKNICISGTCRKVGCDSKLDSDATEDICGICNGDGTQCRIVEEVYKDAGARDYKKIATIPTGSRNIRIEELAPSENTIAISDKSEKHFFLNGDHREEKDGEKTFGKTEGIYSHPEPGKETLFIAGPLGEDLIFFVCFYSSDNVGYSYKYAEATTDLTYNPQYHWELLDWNDCSVKCGGGSQTAIYSCVEDRAGKVSSSFCVGEDKPETEMKKCNEQPCKIKWKVGSWSKCYACKHMSGVRVREVICVQDAPKEGGEDILMEDDKCSGEKPASKELCKSKKTCRSLKTDNIPRNLMKDVWKQIENNSDLKRELDIDTLLDSLSSDNKEDLCSKKNKTTSNVTLLDVGKVIKDRIPKDEIKLIRVPLKQLHLALNLSDKTFEKMGDVVSDNLDTAHAEISTGDAAAKILKELRNSSGEMTANIPTTTVGPTENIHKHKPRKSNIV